MNSFYSQDELIKINFNKVGRNVLISKKCSIYSPQDIEIGDNVRIDDYCILSGRIKIGNNIHISAYSALYGANGIILEDFVTVSGRNMIYSATDDYSGEYMTNPMNEGYRNVIGGPVILCKHTIVGAGCILLPNITLKEGTSVGAMSLVNKSTEEWGVYVGIPAKRIKDRSKKLLEFEGLE